MGTVLDPVSVQRIEGAHPRVKGELALMFNEIAAALSGRAIPRLAYVTRSFDEQATLFAQGRSVPGTKIVTKAGPGRSWHNYGLAWDLVLLKDADGNGTFEAASWETNIDFDKDGKADWMEAVAIAKKYGWEWGGDWKGFTDLPHFQKTFGLTIEEALKRYRAADFHPGTKFIRI